MRKAGSESAWGPPAPGHLWSGHRPCQWRPRDRLHECGYRSGWAGIL